MNTEANEHSTKAADHLRTAAKVLRRFGPEGESAARAVEELADKLPKLLEGRLAR